MERLKAENEVLRRKCSELETELGSIRQSPAQALPDLEEVRDSEALLRSADRILKSLKLGTQAPGYKVARKALDQFIKDLTQ